MGMLSRVSKTNCTIVMLEIRASAGQQWGQRVSGVGQLEAMDVGSDCKMEVKSRKMQEAVRCCASEIVDCNASEQPSTRAMAALDDGQAAILEHGHLRLRGATPAAQFPQCQHVCRAIDLRDSARTIIWGVFVSILTLAIDPLQYTGHAFGSRLFF